MREIGFADSKFPTLAALATLVFLLEYHATEVLVVSYKLLTKHF